MNSHTEHCVDMQKRGYTCVCPAADAAQTKPGPQHVNQDEYGHPLGICAQVKHINEPHPKTSYCQDWSPAQPPERTGPHDYKSTACQHGKHDECRQFCKFCQAPCSCTDCVHVAQERTGRLTAEQLAQKFHETYERLAPQFGYETRKESAKPWADVPEQNRKLMTAVCEEILAFRDASEAQELAALREDRDSLQREAIRAMTELDAAIAKLRQREPAEGER